MPIDARCVERLLEESGARLFTLLYRITRRTDVADDLLQDLAVRLLNSEAFRDATSAEAFAIRTAQRLAFDWLRRQKRYVAALAERPPEVWSEVSSDAELARMDEFTRVLLALDQLSESQRECITLRFIEGHDHQSIAELLGSTPHRVRALIAKGLARVRTLLESQTETVGEEYL